MSLSSFSNQSWSLSGKTAIVTGGSRGIGRAIAVHFARKGLKNLAITYASDSDAAQITIDECRRLGVGQAIAIQANLLDPQFGHIVIQKTLEGLGTTTIDILVNNAVITAMKLIRPVTETTLDDFSQLMQGNVYSQLALTTELLPHLPPKGGGRVINISSVAARIGNPSPTFVYGATKAALESITRSFAKEFAISTGATFTSVSVGPTATEAFEAAKESVPQEYLDAQIAAITAAKRIGTPEDVAFIVGFLASEESRWINGASISANGGLKEGLAALG
ncbi:short-chain dehydrogenase reductase sdr [Colletotrichum incanum]|uniref:Short-chain dehydrogenase reductase sdr n=1 Tax=Colletotrichum incanum TaxID=1573173 RepID=A0A166LRR8_COLIC|nr:short-chain dehydrogenase reductase sdr [Colletotrichum incanum]OHW89493.1 short chain oxidoreductase [Colletotrichum incanum]